MVYILIWREQIHRYIHFKKFIELYSDDLCTLLYACYSPIKMTLWILSC